MSLPMVIDGGAAGLDQSRHHPDAGTSATVTPTPRPRRDETAEEARGGELTALMTRFESLVSLGHAAEALGAARVYIAMERRVGGEPDAITDYPATIREISTIVQAEMATTIQTAVQTAIRTALPQAAPAVSTGSRSWANVAATKHSGGTGATWEPKLVVPARRSREVMIKQGEHDEGEAHRTPADVVAAVNTALGANEAVAVRRFKSGDTLVTFKEQADTYKTNDGWIEKAFGTKATRARREFTVLAKGIPQGAIRTAHTHRETLLADLKKHNMEGIVRVTPRMPKNSNFASLLLGCGSVEAA